jgi:hypothetical protein
VRRKIIDVFIFIHHMVLFLRGSLDGDDGPAPAAPCPAVPPSSLADPPFAT